MKYFAISLLLLSGCSAVPAPDVNYTVSVDSVNNANRQQTELKKQALNGLKDIEIKRIELDNTVKLKKLELAIIRKQENKGGAVAPDISHCEEYRDEYPERFSSCLEDKIKEISTGNLSQHENFHWPIISGDNNVVIIGSPGAEINHDGGWNRQNEEGSATGALIKLIEEDSFTPLPEQPVYKHPVAQAIEETKELAKELAYPILGGVLGWKGLDTLGQGISKDSVLINGGIVSNSNNPVTTTTYPQAVTE